MSNKEIEGINALLKAVANVDDILCVWKDHAIFGGLPSVCVTHEFFIEQFNAYARMPYTETSDCLYTEIDGVMWYCLVGRNEPCSPTEQN